MFLSYRMRRTDEQTAPSEDYLVQFLFHVKIFVHEHQGFHVRSGMSRREKRSYQSTHACAGYGVYRNAMVFQPEHYSNMRKA